MMEEDIQDGRGWYDRKEVSLFPFLIELMIININLYLLIIHNNFILFLILFEF